MDNLFATLQLICVCITLLSFSTMVLLALPKSKLRSCVLEALKYVMAAGFALLILSPIDIVPDVIPVLGQLDDLGYFAGALTAVASAVKERRARRLLEN